MSIEGPAPAPGPAGGKADDATGGADAGAIVIPVLSPEYTLTLTSTVQVRDLETDEVKDISTSATARLSVTQDDTVLGLVFRPCTVTLPEVAGRQPTIDEEVVRAIEPIELTGSLVVEDGRITLVTEPAALQLGIDLADPLTDEVPSEPDDPAVVDQDGDGKPGISVNISGFRVFAGVRVIFALSAPIDDPRTIAGTPSVDVVTRVYGDTIPFFDARRAAREAADGSEVVSEHHTLQLEAWTGGDDGDPTRACD